MVNKKYTLLLALLGLLQLAGFSQEKKSADASADWAMDSSKVSPKKMNQHNEFMNNAYPYPTKPRSQWELGFSGGAGMLFGDINPRLGVSGGISVRKALGHVISLRGGYNGILTTGINVRPYHGYDAGGGYNPWKPYIDAGKPFVPNYKLAVHQLSLDAIISLNNISYYRGNPKVNFYVLAGYSILGADVDVKAYQADGSLYDFSAANIDYSQNSGDIQSDIHDMMDGPSPFDGSDGYVNAPVRHNRENAFSVDDNWLIRHAFNFGGGFAFKVSDRINFGIEQRFTAFATDALDGIEGGSTHDLLSSTQLRMNINMGKSSKTIQPLWWINPNNYAYNELNSPKHMKIPTPVLPDADGDGVTDQFDQEPNTPAGAPVDSHGVSKDTDGDGVPDYKDKELLTPQNCFPVNADGIGNCPEPPCCAELRARLDSGWHGACAIGSLPSIQFKSGSVTLSNAAKASLASVAEQMNANPNCNVRVIGYGASSKKAQQLSWDRVNAVIKYLVEQQGISENRFIFSYGQEGDANTVDLEATTESGPNTVPAPHPNLKRN